MNLRDENRETFKAENLKRSERGAPLCLQFPAEHKSVLFETIEGGGRVFTFMFARRLGAAFSLNVYSLRTVRDVETISPDHDV